MPIPSNYRFKIAFVLYFNNRQLFIRHVFTHKEYDQWTP
ncbi:type II toxin-antitoxin system HigB family toxin [Massilia atriviolacea]|uniref:Type II toxin-antitoxin system HigB family toxin n=1 Tax=Massilia atriviolacea TaxID=2495579 RepID=A0A430HQ09_9BURK|nr:hypothetical protein EJB06_09500 [Massilia atriviolacea]